MIDFFVENLKKCDILDVENFDSVLTGKLQTMQSLLQKPENGNFALDVMYHASPSRKEHHKDKKGGQDFEENNGYD